MEPTRRAGNNNHGVLVVPLLLTFLLGVGAGVVLTVYLWALTIGQGDSASKDSDATSMPLSKPPAADALTAAGTTLPARPSQRKVDQLVDANKEQCGCEQVTTQAWPSARNKDKADEDDESLESMLAEEENTVSVVDPNYDEQYQSEIDAAEMEAIHEIEAQLASQGIYVTEEAVLSEAELERALAEEDEANRLIAIEAAQRAEESSAEADLYGGDRFEQIQQEIWENN